MMHARRACRGHPAARCDDDGPRLQTNLENFPFLGFDSVRILICQGGVPLLLALCAPWPKQSRVRGPRTHFSAGLNRLNTAGTFLVKNVETVGSSIVSTTQAPSTQCRRMCCVCTHRRDCGPCAAHTSSGAPADATAPCIVLCRSCRPVTRKARAVADE